MHTRRGNIARVIVKPLPYKQKYLMEKCQAIPILIKKGS